MIDNEICLFLLINCTTSNSSANEWTVPFSENHPVDLIYFEYEK